MKLLIVTPTLGQSPFLERTVASVDGFRRPGVLLEHVIVVPLPFVVAIAEKYPRCIVVAEKARGMYSAINQGIALSKVDFEFWTYINDDDFLLADFGEVINKASKLSFLLPVVIYGEVLIVDSRDAVQNRVARWGFPSFIKGALSGRRSPLNQQGALWSRATLTSVGYFDEALKYASDYDYFFRCAVGGAVFYYVKKPVGAYRIHPNQLGQEGSAFIKELDLVRARYTVWPLYRLFCECLFIILNADIYLWRIIRHKPFGVALFSRFS